MSDEKIQQIHNEIVRVVFGTGGYNTNDFPCYVNWTGGDNYAIVDRVRTFFGSFDCIMTALKMLRTKDGYAALVEVFSCKPGIRVEPIEQASFTVILSKTLVTKVLTLTDLLGKPEVEFGAALHELIQGYEKEKRARLFITDALKKNLERGPRLDSVKEHLEQILKVIEKGKE
jgi:hypothetical protein